MNKKILLGILSILLIFTLVACNKEVNNNENLVVGDNQEGNSGSAINGEVDNVQNEEIKDSTLDLTTEEIITLLKLDFSDSFSDLNNRITINKEGTNITFQTDSFDSEYKKQALIVGFEGNLKSMKYMMVPQVAMYGELVLLTEQGEVYVTANHVADENDEVLVKEFVMKKIETPYPVESIAGYEFGSHINIPVLKYKNGTYGEIKLGEDKVSEIKLIKECLIKELLCGEYKTEKVIENNVESIVLDKYNINLFIGYTSPENDFGMNMSYINSDDIFYTTKESDVILDFDNNIINIPDSIYNEATLNFDYFEFDIDNDTLEVSLNGVVSGNEKIVIEFEKN